LAVEGPPQALTTRVVRWAKAGAEVLANDLTVVRGWSKRSTFIREGRRERWTIAARDKGYLPRRGSKAERFPMSGH
jgi:hypothetical protein